jgi:sn-glycerol 3-phosphate transport system substrate-binding protein
VNNDAIKAHFTALTEWQDAGYFEWYGTGWGDNQDAFTQKRVAMWLGSSGSFGGLKASTDFEFGASYLPYWASLTDQPYSTFIGGAAVFAMSGKSDEENRATADFLEFLASPEVQYVWHKDTGYVPITNAAYELAKADGYYESTPDAEVGILQLSQPVGEWTKGYRLGFYVQIREVMYNQFEGIFSGETSVDDAFANIEKDANDLLARFHQTYN